MEQVINPEVLGAIALLAVINQSLVGMFVTPIFEWRKWDRKYILYVALATGVVLGMTITKTVFVSGLFAVPVIDKLLTGLLIGGGASLIYDIVDRGGSPPGTTK